MKIQKNKDLIVLLIVILLNLITPIYSYITLHNEYQFIGNGQGYKEIQVDDLKCQLYIDTFFEVFITENIGVNCK